MAPRIVVLDAYTLNPGDLSWDGLRGLGSCTIHDRTPAGEVVERAHDAEIILTNKTPVPADAIDGLKQLRYIGVLATGYNIVDVAAARERGIPVTNVPTYGTNTVAQMTMAHVLNLTQRVGYHADAVRYGRWASCDDFCFWDHPLVELDGLTMGIVGFGRIGQATARLALAFGMRVLVHTPEDVEPRPGVEPVDLDTLLRESDVVTLHCPLTDDTHHLINGPRLAMMKSSALLINTSRGPLVDEQALADALNEQRLAGAGLDVLAEEPPPRDHPLPAARNCYVTPHIAWAARASRQRLLHVAVDNVAAFLAGQPRNVVNEGAGS